jgi:hypothetical protein
LLGNAGEANMGTAIDRSFLTRLLQTTGLCLALMTASAAEVRAETVVVQGANGVTDANGNGTNGGDAAAIAISSDPSNTAVATGGNGGIEANQLTESPGAGGNATATAISSTEGGVTAIAGASATGGIGGDGLGSPGAANASSTATTSLAGISVQSDAVASSGIYGGVPVATFAVAQVGSGQSVLNLFDSAGVVSTILPGKAYAATAIGDANDVADALLGPHDKIFGIAILGADFSEDGGFGSGSATATFDFTYHGDLILGEADDNTVTNLGANVGSLTLYGPPSGAPAVYVIGAVIPEPSTWALMLLGFAGLGFAGWRGQRKAALI